MKKIRMAAVAALAVVLLLLFTACFSGAQDSNAPSGMRENVYYLYLEQESLLILRGTGTLAADNRILQMDFVPFVQEIYLSKGITGYEKGAFDSMEKLQRVYAYENLESNAADSLKADGSAFTLLCGITDFEEKAYLLSGRLLGHCPEKISGECLLCGKDCLYQYNDLYVSLYIDGKAVKDTVVRTEGLERHFDSEGKLICEGFSVVGGYMRYFRNNRMITGNADIDGMRYSFSSDGFVVSEKVIDTKLPFRLFLPAVAAVPVGLCMVFGVRMLYKKRSRERD